MLVARRFDRRDLPLGPTPTIFVNFRPGVVVEEKVERKGEQQSSQCPDRPRLLRPNHAFEEYLARDEVRAQRAFVERLQTEAIRNGKTVDILFECWCTGYG